MDKSQPWVYLEESAQKTKSDLWVCDHDFQEAGVAKDK